MTVTLLFAVHHAMTPASHLQCVELQFRVGPERENIFEVKRIPISGEALTKQELKAVRRKETAGKEGSLFLALKPGKCCVCAEFVT